MRRFCLPALCASVLVVTACTSDSTQVDPRTTESAVDEFRIQPRSAGANFQFVAPLGPTPSPSGPLDSLLAPRVEVCEGTSSPCLNPVVTFTEATQPAVRPFVAEDFFSVDWDTRQQPPAAGVLHRVRVFVGPLEMGFADVVFLAGSNRNSAPVTPDVTTVRLGSVLPIRFRIEAGALPVASGCTVNPQVLDCDVIQVRIPVGGVVQVGDPRTQEFASEIRVAPGDAIVPNGEPHFVLALEHIIPTPPVSLPTVWVPFFVRASAKDSDGNDVTFRNGADMVLCQPAALNDPQQPGSLPHHLHQYLEIVRVSSGQATPLPTTPGAPQCAGPGSAPNRTTPQLSVAQRLLDGLRALGAVWKAEPLRALHGGLNTRGLLGFSEFGSTLPIVPSASWAIVPPGTVGTPTVIEMTTAVRPGVPHPAGGGVVRGVVSGANAGAPVTVTNNQDGTYTLVYTPTSSGIDQVTITIDGVPIGGSPYGAGVGLTGYGTPTIDGVKSPGEWAGAVQAPIFTGPYAGSTLYRLNDAGSLYFGIEVHDPNPHRHDVIRIRFDNDVDGRATPGDDALRIDPSGFRDGHFAGFWTAPDTVVHGTGAVGYTGSTTFHELGHLLRSGDPQDFALTAGEDVGFCVIFLEQEQTSADRQFPAGCGGSVLDQSSYARLRVLGPSG